MTLPALVIDPGKCTSCLQCEMACSLEKEGLFAPAFSRIKVFEFEHGRRSVPYTCTQCEPAWCLHACPTDAISVGADGVKRIDEDACVGCRACTIACPYGTVNHNTRSGKAVKCDHCGGDPACAAACPTGAILFDRGDGSAAGAPTGASTGASAGAGSAP